MKTRLIIFCILFSISNCYAQIEKGTLLPSASTFIWGQKNTTQDSLKNKNTSSYFNSGINLYFGKFIKENLLLTLGFGYSFQKTTNEQHGKKPNKYNTLSTNYNQTESILFGLQKFKFISKELGFKYGFNFDLGFIEINRKSDVLQYNSYDVNTGETIYTNLKSTSYTNNLYSGLSFNSGFLYFINKNISLNANISFLNYRFAYSVYEKTKNKANVYDHSFSAFPGFNNFSVGISYFFRPKNKNT